MAEITLPVLFMLLMVALWVALGLGAAWIGGWSTLAIYYRAATAFHGTRWRFASARLRCISYRQCLTLGADLRGLHVAIWLPLRFGHPTLFVPWSEIDAVEPCCGSLRPTVRLHVRRAPGMAFKLPRHLAISALKEIHSGRLLPPGASTLLEDTRARMTTTQPLEST